jgi:hypothetical protein
MRVLYGEGPATHTGPESCIGAGNCAGETLTGERTGRPLSRERSSPAIAGTPGCRRRGSRRKAGRADIARHVWTPRGLKPRACTETSRTGTGRSLGRLRRDKPQAASGTREEYADDARAWEVGQTHSTGEAAEQRPMAAEAVEGRGWPRGIGLSKTRPGLYAGQARQVARADAKAAQLGMSPS